MNTFILFSENCERYGRVINCTITESINRLPQIDLEFQPYQDEIIPFEHVFFLFVYNKDSFFYQYGMFYPKSYTYRYNIYKINAILYNHQMPEAFVEKHHQLLLDLQLHPDYSQEEFHQLCKSERIQAIQGSDLIL